MPRDYAEKNRIEQELAIRLHAGDETAMAELYKRLFPSMRGYALKMTGEPEDAHDIAQDALLAAFTNIKKWRGAPIGLWVRRILRNRALDHIRKQARRTHSDIEDWLPILRDEKFNVKDAVNARLEWLPLRQALENAPAIHREIIQLAYFEQLTTEEMVRRTGQNKNAVFVRLHRAREYLKDALGEVYETLYA